MLSFILSSNLSTPRCAILFNSRRILNLNKGNPLDRNGGLFTLLKQCIQKLSGKISHMKKS